MRATQHFGRLGSARHNDREFDLEKASHIDRERSVNNEYFCCYPEMSFVEAEKKFYAENFREMIEDINFRAERSYHPERKTNAEKLIKSKKTMPEEVIFQIGDKDSVSEITAEQVKSVFEEFNQWHEKKFGEFIKTLSIAFHQDEKTFHFHVRRVWTYDNPKGFKAIGQHKALEQMGYQLPDSSKARGRHNNLKQVYTAECRQMWLDLCHEKGIEVEREPLYRAPTEQNLKKNDFIIRKQEKEIKNLEEKIEDARERHLEASQSVLNVQASVDTLNGALTSLRGEYDTRRAYVESCKEFSNVSEMYPEYAIKKKSLFGKETVTVPKEKWEQLHVSAGEKRYLDVATSALERNISKFRKTTSAKYLVELKETISSLRSHVEDLKDENLDLKCEVKSTKKELGRLTSKIKNFFNRLPEDLSEKLAKQWDDLDRKNDRNMCR